MKFNKWITEWINQSTKNRQYNSNTKKCNVMKRENELIEIWKEKKIGLKKITAFSEGFMLLEKRKSENYEYRSLEW